MKQVIQKAKGIYYGQLPGSGFVCGKYAASCTWAYFSPPCFKKETGQAYTAYLTQVRLDKAVELLNKTDDKTYVIAAKSGISGQNYFSYVFKSVSGSRPPSSEGKIDIKGLLGA